MHCLTCLGCGVTKPADDFYCSNKSRCKECVKTGVRERRRTDPSVREYDRARARLPHRQALRARVSREWREANPAAYRAQTAVGNALRDGKLTKEPCIFCGSTKRLEAHHHDYSKPLEVTWLCPKCHKRFHAMSERHEGAHKS